MAVAIWVLTALLWLSRYRHHRWEGRPPRRHVVPSPKRSESGGERFRWARGRPAETRSFMSVGSAPRSPRRCISSATDRAGAATTCPGLASGAWPAPWCLARPWFPVRCPRRRTLPSERLRRTGSWQGRAAYGFGDYGEGRSDRSASVRFARDVLIRGGRQGVGAPHCRTPVRSVSLRTSGVRGRVAARPFCTWGRRKRRPLSRCRGPPRLRG